MSELRISRQQQRSTLRMLAWRDTNQVAQQNRAENPSLTPAPRRGRRNYARWYAKWLSKSVGYPQIMQLIASNTTLQTYGPTELEPVQWKFEFLDWSDMFTETNEEDSNAR